MIGLRQTQRGAVTLIGALFIVVVLSVMAISQLYIAGSNILDTAAHNDSVEALFVAETGIEYASFLYAGSGNCTGLSGLGPVRAGRGEFLLKNALIQVGDECRVRVTGSVGSTPDTPPAIRTVEADLRRSGDTITLVRWEEIIGN